MYSHNLKNSMKITLFILLLTIYLRGYSQTYTNPIPKPIKIEVSQKPKTSADHYSDLQKKLNNISNDFANSSLAESMNEQRKKTGIQYLGNGNYKIIEVGSSGFVSLKKLKKRANERLNVFVQKENLKFEVKNVLEFKQSFGVLPKVELEFTVLNQDNTPKLLTEELKFKLNKLKEYLELEVITEIEYNEMADIIKNELKKRLIGK